MGGTEEGGVNWDKWVWDVSMGGDEEYACFCPVEFGEDGEVSNVIVGMNYLGPRPPRGEVIGIFHVDGMDAVEKWQNNHPNWQSRMADFNLTSSPTPPR